MEGRKLHVVDFSPSSVVGSISFELILFAQAVPRQVSALVAQPAPPPVSHNTDVYTEHESCCTLQCVKQCLCACDTTNYKWYDMRGKGAVIIFFLIIIYIVGWAVFVAGLFLMCVLMMLCGSNNNNN